VRGEELTVRKPERRSLGGFERRTGEKRGSEDYASRKLRRRNASVGLRGEERRGRRPGERVCWREEDDSPEIFSPTLWNFFHGLVHASPEKAPSSQVGRGKIRGHCRAASGSICPRIRYTQSSTCPSDIQT
jgi:hypothetical protein